MKITKTQIKELHEIGNEQTKSKLKELFSEVLDNELEVGVWYHRDKELLVWNEKKITYGFNIKGYFFDDLRCSFIINPIKADTEEIAEALKNEAIKRGLVEGAKTKSAFKGWAKHNSLNKCEMSKDYIFKTESNELLAFGVLVFKDGKWATPIKTITIKEAEEMLKMKIVG